MKTNKNGSWDVSEQLTGKINLKKQQNQFEHFAVSFWSIGLISQFSRMSFCFYMGK